MLKGGNIIKITIFTPTYNRAHTLVKCYESLLNQTSNKFIWIIVDDGSTDETQRLVDRWISDNLIRIRYHRQPNQGKHIAFNSGVEMSNTDLFLCLDSDDFLSHNAVECLLEFWPEKSNKEFAGIIACKADSKGQVIGTTLPSNIVTCTVYDLYNRLGVQGDKLMVFKTEIIKNYPFPKINGEKFITEGYLYDQLDSKYKWLLLNEIIYYGDYLLDGYTANDKKLLIKNPKGFSLYFRNRMKISHSFIERYKNAVRYVNCCWIAGSHEYIKQSPRKVLTVAAVPAAIILYFSKYNNLRRK
ncbi:glycosyltransferase family 2 protein [Heyndrickxia sp. MSNUG]|uniref:glycosyltransferase family 2 protein n=1 Tax=Heyndrickxia sp. MSNUG TaxID=3136677 RepID=UPI003C2F41E9